MIEKAKKHSSTEREPFPWMGLLTLGGLAATIVAAGYGLYAESAGQKNEANDKVLNLLSEYGTKLPIDDLLANPNQWQPLNQVVSTPLSSEDLKYLYHEAPETGQPFVIDLPDDFTHTTITEIDPGIGIAPIVPGRPPIAVPGAGREVKVVETEPTREIVLYEAEEPSGWTGDNPSILNVDELAGATISTSFSQLVPSDTQVWVKLHEGKIIFKVTMPSDHEDVSLIAVVDK